MVDKKDAVENKASAIKQAYAGISRAVAIRMENNAELRYNPMFRVAGEKYSIQIGPHVIIVNSHIPYIGWDNYFEVFKGVIDKVYETIGQIQRIGLRYINFFDQDIHDQVDVQVRLAQTNCHDFIIKARIDNEDDTMSIIQYTPNAIVHSDDKTLKGSIIDLDVSMSFDQGCQKETLFNKLAQVHNNEKNLFFSLIKSELLNQLNPNF